MWVHLASAQSTPRGKDFSHWPLPLHRGGPRRHRVTATTVGTPYLTPGKSSLKHIVPITKALHGAFLKPSRVVKGLINKLFPQVPGTEPILDTSRHPGTLGTTKRPALGTAVNKLHGSLSIPCNIPAMADAGRDRPTKASCVWPTSAGFFSTFLVLYLATRPTV